MKKLNVGDVIIVSSILSGKREYSVLSIDGNKAKTKFRTFNRNIAQDGSVYEYGKRLNQTTNGYWAKQ